MGKIRQGYDLASTHPTLIKELHPTKNYIHPSEISYGTKAKLFWLCSNGHYYDATPISRIKGGGCPFCSNRRLGQGNDLSTKYPLLALEWQTNLNGFPPSKQVSGGLFKAWWKCSNCGYEWKRDVKGRVDGAGCTKCKRKNDQKIRNQKNILSKGSLRSNFPLVAKEWHPKKNILDSNEYLSGSGELAWWLCPRGHEYQMSIKERTKKESYGCPKCTGNTSKLEIRGLSELMYVFGRLAWREKIKGHEADIFSKDFGFIVEVDGYPWHKEKINSDKKKTEHFESLGLKVFRLRDDRLVSLKGNEIKFNSRNFSDVSFHLSIQKLIQLIIRNVKSFPKDVLSKSTDYINSKNYLGEKNYQYYLRYYRGPAPRKSLEDKFPDIASEWSDKNFLKPSEVHYGSGEKYWFICPEGHEYSQRLKSKVFIKAKCPVCANRQTLEGFNDLESNYPDISKEWSKNNDGLPNEFVYSSKKKALWICKKCNKEYESAIRNRTQKNTSCPSCSKRLAWVNRRLNM